MKLCCESKFFVYALAKRHGDTRDKRIHMDCPNIGIYIWLIILRWGFLVWKGEEKKKKKTIDRYSNVRLFLATKKEMRKWKKIPIPKHITYNEHTHILDRYTHYENEMMRSKTIHCQRNGKMLKLVRWNDAANFHFVDTWKWMNR